MELFDDLHAFLWTDPTVNNANTYFIDASKKILIDPGHAHCFGSVKAHLKELGVSAADVDLVIVTHCHPDHVEALRFFFKTATLVAFPEAEMSSLNKEAPQYWASLGLAEFQPDILLREGTLSAGDCEFDIYSTPGHSPGSICIYWGRRQVLFTGDVVFKQGVGRTDLPGGNGEDLKRSILKLSRLDVQYLLPGHGEVIKGRDAVRKNFEEIQRLWFAYL